MLNDLTREMVAPTSMAHRQAQATAQMIQHPADMQAVFSPNGLQGAMARGNNVYLGGLPNAPGAGRPPNPTPNFGNIADPAMQAAIQRRIQGRKAETDARQARDARRPQ